LLKQKNQELLLSKPLIKILFFECFIQLFAPRRILVQTYVSCHLSGYVVFLKS